MLANVRAHLALVRAERLDEVSVWRLRQMADDARGEVRAALRPFGFYRPRIDVRLEEPAAEGRPWRARIRIEPGTPVQIGEVRIDFPATAPRIPSCWPGAATGRCSKARACCTPATRRPGASSIAWPRPAATSMPAFASAESPLTRPQPGPCADPFRYRPPLPLRQLPGRRCRVLRAPDGSSHHHRVKPALPQLDHGSAARSPGALRPVRTGHRRRGTRPRRGPGRPALPARNPAAQQLPRHRRHRHRHRCPSPAGLDPALPVLARQPARIGLWRPATQ
jgi:hypothetical protein